MARANKSKHAILAMLSLGPRSGYDIERDLRRSVSHFWNESYGQIYPTLKALAAEGLATVHEEPQEGRPDRKIYTITGRGKESLQRWFEAPPEPPPVRNEMLLKLFVGWQAPADVLEAHVSELLEYFSRELEQFEVYERFLKEQARENPDALYWLITVRSGQLYMQARRQWCEETLPLLQTIARSRSGRDISPEERTQQMSRIMALAHEGLPAKENRAHQRKVTP